MKCTDETIVPEEMSHARIEAVVAAFAQAAARARNAGFDCVEIHAAHGYLISQFLNPFENRRTDDFGGSLANRARFGLYVLRAVKTAAGDMPVIFRLSVDDYFPGGMPFAEGKRVALWAAEAGADALHIAAGPLSLAAVGRAHDSADGVSKTEPSLPMQPTSKRTCAFL